MIALVNVPTLVKLYYKKRLYVLYPSQKELATRLLDNELAKTEHSLKKKLLYQKIKNVVSVS